MREIAALIVSAAWFAGIAFAYIAHGAGFAVLAFFLPPYAFVVLAIELIRRFA